MLAKRHTYSNTRQMARQSRRALSISIFLFPLFLFVGCSDPEAQFSERFERAQTLVQQGQFDSAIEELNRLNEEYPGRGVVLREMGRANEGAGETFFAGLFYEQAGRIDPEFAESLFPAAEIFAAEGEGDRALGAIDDYLILYPDDDAAWRLSADLHAQANRPQSALSAHLRAERLDGPSRNPEYAAEVGDLYLEAGNLAQAEIYYQTALTDAPDDQFRALMGLLVVYYQSDNFPRAEETLITLDEEFPGAVEASAISTAREEIQLWRATQDELAAQIVRLESVKEEEQEESGSGADEASDDGEGLPPGEGTNGDIAMSDENKINGDTPAAPMGKFAGLEEAEQAVVEEELPPPPPSPTTAELAFAARQAGELQDSIQLFWKAVQEDPDDAELWAELSATYLRAGEPDNAEIAILEALRRDPSSLQFTLTYLKVVQQSRSQARFLEELESAYNRIPNSPDIVLSLARVYGQPGGNPTNAAYYYKKFIQMAPGHPEVATARRELNALP